MSKFGWNILNHSSDINNMQTEFLQKGKFSRSGMLKVVKEVKLYVCVCVCGGGGGRGEGWMACQHTCVSGMLM